MEPDKYTDFIKSLQSLLLTTIGIFGPFWSVVIVIFISTGVFIWKKYNHTRKDRFHQMVIDEKDKTIKRMKEENRMMRIVEFKRLGWDKEEIDKYVV